MSDYQPSADLPTEVLPATDQIYGLFDLALSQESGDHIADVSKERGLLAPGQQVGRYKLIDKLGEGGFGVVWRAEQLEPFHREVALKLIKPGMDSRQVIARFAMERQTIALMEHPHIASVLDAGATSLGHPFFVMEIVRGEPITTYCDLHRLTIRQRLELFVPVCHGVQHAHQKAILHRDLKPSNILVEDVDEIPTPKIIDFGIAKALGVGVRASSEASSVLTSAGYIIGTPQYMSPEQAGRDADVDACSDIYSLGTILYELLIGSPPIHSEQVRLLPLDKVLGIIREVEPARPSQRVLSAADSLAVGEHGRNRQTDPRRLAQELRGDLDWIVLKALEKDRTRRYDSVAALAMDIQRHLRDEPVIARPPTRRYILKKWIRRNKLAFGGGMTIAMAIFTGAGAALWSYQRQNEALIRSRIAESLARSESDKSRQVASFLGSIFQEISLRNSNSLTADALRDLLDSADERRRRDLARHPETDMRVSLILAQAYCELDKLGTAEQLYQNAFNRLEQLRLESSAEAADCLFWIVWTRHRQVEEPSTATTSSADEDLLRRCLAIRRRLLPENDEALIRTQALLVEVLRDNGQIAQATAVLEKLVNGPEQAQIKATAGYGWLLREQALLDQQQGRVTEALQAIDQARKILVTSATTLNQRRQVEADVYRIERICALQAGDLDGAENAANEELNVRHLWLGYEDPGVLVDLADVSLRRELFRDAESKLRRALAIGRSFGWLKEQERALIFLTKNQDLLYPEDAAQKLNNTTELAQVLLSQADQARRAGQNYQAFLARAELVLRTEPPDPALPEAAAFYATRASLAARRGDYHTAIAALVRAEGIAPDTLFYHFQTAILHLAAQDPSAFELEREYLMRNLKSATTAENLLWIYRAALLRPARDPEHLQQIRQSLHQYGFQSNTLGDEWVALLMGLVEYRAGNYQDAVNWLEDAQRSTKPEVFVQAQLVIAMNRHYLNQLEAQVSLVEGVTGFEEHFKRFEGIDSKPLLYDYLTVKLLKEEAEAIVSSNL